MNAPIEALMEQAGIYENRYTAEKFAELIVRECACLSYFDDSGNPEVEEALEFWRKNMLKHFGVKE
jgi:hypothetical protein